MITLFTDFSTGGFYVGQVKMAIKATCDAAVVATEKKPTVDIVDLIHDAPMADPFLSSYLLAALAVHLPLGSICLAVVDPGVGSSRPGVMINADGRFFIGPGNGLFEHIARRAKQCAWHRINIDHDRVSPSFHGRDVFAPIAAKLACGTLTEKDVLPLSGNPTARPDWPDDCLRIIHIDHFGNAITAHRADDAPPKATIVIPDRPRIDPIGNAPTDTATNDKNPGGDATIGNAPTNTAAIVKNPNDKNPGGNAAIVKNPIVKNPGGNAAIVKKPIVKNPGGKVSIGKARVFADCAKGALFYYRNSIGMIEIAANQANAAEILSLRIGQEVAFA